MNSPRACAQGSCDWRSEPRGWWIFWIWLAILVGSLLPTFDQVVSGILGGPDFRISSDPPFYYIHRDVIRGICAAAGLLAMFAVTSLTWSDSPFASLMAQSMSIIFLGQSAAPALYTWLQCDAIFTPNVRCPWPTFEAYLYDQWRLFAMFIPIGVGVVYMVWGFRRLCKRQDQPSVQE